MSSTSSVFRPLRAPSAAPRGCRNPSGCAVPPMTSLGCDHRFQVDQVRPGRRRRPSTWPTAASAGPRVRSTASDASRTIKLESWTSPRSCRGVRRRLGPAIAQRPLHRIGGLMPTKVVGHVRVVTRDRRELDPCPRMSAGSPAARRSATGGPPQRTPRSSTRRRGDPAARGRVATRPEKLCPEPDDRGVTGREGGRFVKDLRNALPVLTLPLRAECVHDERREGQHPSGSARFQELTPDFLPPLHDAV